MCIPILAAVAIGSLALGVTQTVMASNAAKKQAQSQKDQLAVQAATNQQNAELAKQNEDLALSTAKTNSDQLLSITAANNKQLLDITAANANSRQQITDINVGLASSISNFNQQVADGNAQMLIGKGEMQASFSEANAQSDKLNAGYQEQAAQDSLTASHQDEQASRLNYARLKSTQRATLAANGVALDEGSALRIQTDTDYLSDVDAATINANGIRAAMGYRQQETNSLIQAAEDTTAAKVARVNAATEAASVQAQAAGAKMATDRDILNLKLSTSFDILQAQRDADMKVANANANAAVGSANILNQGRVEATNYEMQASGFTGAAKAETIQGNGISPSGAAAQAFIGGAASVAGKWFSYQQSGVFG